MRGRFLKCFQERVERAAGEHVRFVDDVHFVFRTDRCVNHLIGHFADVVDAVVGGCVHLQYVDQGAVIGAAADGTGVAWVAVCRIEAVYGLRVDFCQRRFACAPGAGEQERMIYRTVSDTLPQRVDNMFLRNDLIKCLRTKGTVQGYVCHSCLDLLRLK